MGPETTTERTTCAIAGGGPAGLVLGLLLARAGVRVTVLEKHADFLRDFRGDTVHPTTMTMLDDLGLFDRFDALPQTRMRDGAYTAPDGTRTTVVDFTRLPLRHPYIALVPQWDLLDLLADAAAAAPTFDLRREHAVTGLLQRGGRTVGLAYDAPEGPGRLFADLVVACDGRRSTVRAALGLPVSVTPVAFDAWWFRVPTARPLGDSLLPRAARGVLMVAIPRRGYLQVARLGPKGGDGALRARGIEALRAEVAALFPEPAVESWRIASTDDVAHLDVRVDRLRRWWAPGALCIGDAAHAMSPLGGVGINLAVQDAIAAARVLARPLARGTVHGRRGIRLLERVQRRRTPPTVAVQAMQRLLHARLLEPVLAGGELRPPAALLDLLRRAPWLTAVPAAAIGVGPRPERVPRWARRRGGGR